MDTSTASSLVAVGLQLEIAEDSGRSCPGLMCDRGGAHLVLGVDDAGILLPSLERVDARAIGDRTKTRITSGELVPAPD